MPKAGILLYRNGMFENFEVLLVHPGGPDYRFKEDGVWRIPGGELADGEQAIAGAKREFKEETDCDPPEYLIELGPIKQRHGGMMYVWAAEKNWDPRKLKSNTFNLLLPNRGIVATYPEVDRAEWFDIPTAERKIFAGQRGFLDILTRRLNYCASLASIGTGQLAGDKLAA
jgi:predicted NUDIX family NTP pyrophosphohydrolase